MGPVTTENRVNFLKSWCVSGYETLCRERAISAKSIGAANLRLRIVQQEEIAATTTFTTTPPGYGPFRAENGEWAEQPYRPELHR